MLFDIFGFIVVTGKKMFYKVFKLVGHYSWFQCRVKGTQFYIPFFFSKKADSKTVFQRTPSPYLSASLFEGERLFSLTSLFLFKTCQRSTENVISCEDVFFFFFLFSPHKRTLDCYALSETTNSFHASHHASIRLEWPLVVGLILVTALDLNYRFRRRGLSVQ